MSDITLEFDDKEIHWQVGESLVRRLELEGFVKEVFPLHGMVTCFSLPYHWIHLSWASEWNEYSFLDEATRKKLLKRWALSYGDFTRQPIDEIYSYYGIKVIFKKVNTHFIILLFPSLTINWVFYACQIALYFAFLEKYTRWLLFPTAFGLILQFVNFGWASPILTYVLSFYFVLQATATRVSFI